MVILSLAHKVWDQVENGDLRRRRGHANFGEVPYFVGRTGGKSSDPIEMLDFLVKALLFIFLTEWEIQYSKRNDAAINGWQFSVVINIRHCTEICTFKLYFGLLGLLVGSTFVHYCTVLTS